MIFFYDMIEKYGSDHSIESNRKSYSMEKKSYYMEKEIEILPASA